MKMFVKSKFQNISEANDLSAEFLQKRATH